MFCAISGEYILLPATLVDNFGNVRGIAEDALHRLTVRGGAGVFIPLDFNSLTIYTYLRTQSEWCDQPKDYMEAQLKYLTNSVGYGHSAVGLVDEAGCDLEVVTCSAFDGIRMRKIPPKAEFYFTGRGGGLREILDTLYAARRDGILEIRDDKEFLEFLVTATKDLYVCRQPEYKIGNLKEWRRGNLVKYLNSQASRDTTILPISLHLEELVKKLSPELAEQLVEHKPEMDGENTARYPGGIDHLIRQYY